MQVAALLTAALIVSLSFTALLASPRAAFRILDTPNERSLHARAMPRTGGLAILMSVLIALGLLATAWRAGLATGVAAAAALELGHRDILVTLFGAAFLGAVSLLN